ncbi:hypothetical protein [Cohnella terricola]|uniref:Uncharacterized protein n=1 Tax=Cohnella terricola TaxID=1289167 RepID=A0A559J5D8_9BACL|nr:hypothetical protein [Cohnella terricola]TVX95100.1 hypothetical protein FPZ45_24150 [Cohnella terricola]
MKYSFNQMDRNMFKENLLKTIEELLALQKIHAYNVIKFILSVDEESEKSHNSNDDFMRLGILSKENINDREFMLEDIINMLVHPRLHYPLWINVSVYEIKEDIIIIKLKSSSRFRRPSELLNKETNHPPFKAIT